MRPALFTDVAMLLVNGNDPKRLAVALASYSRLIGTRRPNEDDDRDDCRPSALIGQNGLIA